MIFKDKDGFLANETLDLADSCFRCGIATVFKLPEKYMNIFHYIDPILTPRRHPTQIPANNPKNFSKDQLIPLMAALYLKDDTFYSRQIFWKLFFRGFFCFNTERDWPGSTKNPWPEKMVSKDPNDNGKWRYFDAPDPLFLSPHVLWFLARCSRLYFVELLLAPIGILWLFLNVRFQSKNTSHENNQILVITKIMGQLWVDLYKKHNPKWKMQVRNYWYSRNEHDYATCIIENY